MRYNSGKNFVQTTLGKLSRKGDFLLEMYGIKGRTDILFHQGNKPEHSTGCILLGPANKGTEGGVFIGDDHPLRKLRLLFYGTDEPISCPNKNIEIKIVEKGNSVTIHYGFSNPNGITFKHKGASYTFRAGQKHSFKVNSTSGETLEIWECPTNQTCRWSSFTIYPGNEYVITDSGNGRGLTLKKK